MSDPITNAQIEDVLSSIRKLVTEEIRKGDGEPRAKPDTSDRLVLTPSLRVEPPEETADFEEAEIAEWEAEETEHALVSPQDTPADASFDDAESESDDAEIRPEEVPVFLKAAEPPEELEQAPAESVSATEDKPEPLQEAPEGLSSKIEALEAAIADTRDQWEADPPLGDAYSGTAETMAWQDAEPDLATIDEPVMDEEALRELVAEIVREELQGALGERITRNVRKLVRREIQRALASQDLI